MKNKTPMVDQPGQTISLDWLYQEGEDDFLMGKTPKDLSGLWEEEE